MLRFQNRRVAAIWCFILTVNAMEIWLPANFGTYFVTNVTNTIATVGFMIIGAMTMLVSIFGDNLSPSKVHFHSALANSPLVDGPFVGCVVWTGMLIHQDWVVIPACVLGWLMFMTGMRWRARQEASRGEGSGPI